MGLALISAVVLLAAPPPAPAVTRLTLDNGMRWLLVPRPGAPRIGGVVAVRAGGVDEQPGTTGVAHLLEHLAFSGTPMVGPTRGWRVEAPFHDDAMDAMDALGWYEKHQAQSTLRAMQLHTLVVKLENQWHEKFDVHAHWRLLQERDITANANTTKHMTRYIGDLPASQLPVWLTLEAQRFAAPVFRDFRVERSVVLQELRDRATPQARADDQLDWMAFGRSGQGWPVIGWEADVRALAPADLDAFYAAHYTPENAVGCLVGDFDVETVKRLLQATFGALPPRAAQPRREVALQPPARAHVDGPTREVLVAFPMPGRQEPGWKRRRVALELLSDCTLCDSLTRPGSPVARVDVQLQPGEWAPHLAVFHLAVAPGADAAAAERAFWDALAVLRPTAEDLADAYASLALDHAEATRTRLDLAQAMTEAELMFGTWEAGWAAVAEEPPLDEVLDELARAFRPETAFVVDVGPKR